MVRSQLNDWLGPEYKRSDFGHLVRSKYAKLSKADREKVESEYHRMKPEDFDPSMFRAKPHAPETIRLSNGQPRSAEVTQLKRLAGLLKK